jgi:outer membrane murein-binding lipoprotein Lpp
MKRIVFSAAVFLILFVCIGTLHASPADTIQHRIDDLQTKIDSGLRYRQLTEPEAKNLQKRLDNIKISFEKAKGKNLPPSSVTSINQKLDALTKDVSKERHDAQKTANPSAEKRINDRINTLQTKIDSGSKSGQLTDDETRSLQSRLNAIKNRFEGVKKNSLTTQETKAINGQLDNLSRDISKQKYDDHRKKSKR